ncbi:MAG: hypothetical protein ACM3U2_24575 [Deltaproteobacteria bacterium]
MSQDGESVANYDFVFPYDARMETSLRQEQYPHPVPSPRNRFPTKQEVIDAIARSGVLRVEEEEADEFFAVWKSSRVGGEYATRISCCPDWNRLGKRDTDSITMHGDFRAELILVEIPSHKCGQLVLHPDTGCPAVIVEPGMDVERVAALWDDAVEQRDSWAYFYARMGYGATTRDDF